MRRVATLVSTAAVMMFTVGLLAQAKPNFAGKWVREAPAAPATPPAGGGGGGGGRGGGGGWGATNTITQDATTLTVEYTQGENPVKLVYKLDGTESKNTMQGRGGAMEQVSKAAWVGNTLVITTTTQMGESKRVVSLEGGNLVIETTNPGREGGTPTTTKAVYKKG